jgi:DUF4097 and DUF4098 domain-containing protein YvlB
MKIQRPFAVMALMFVAAGAGAFCLPRAEGTFDRNLNVSGPVDLEVSTGSGSIRVRPGDSSVVRIHGRITAGDDSSMDAEEKVRYLASNPPVEHTGNIIRIGRIDDRRLRNNVSISYELEVPAETRLQSRTGSGEQIIDGVRGPAELSTGSGNLTGTNIAAEVRARTGSGRINLDAIGGRVEASTGSGSIRVTRCAGGLRANSGSGSITFEQTAPGDVEVQTGSGSLNLSGIRGALRAETGSGSITAGGEPTGEWRIDAASGGITLRLTPDSAFDLDARTSSGRITVDHPVTVTGTVHPKELRGRVRGGGVLLGVRTSSGDIRIQ